MRDERACIQAAEFQIFARALNFKFMPGKVSGSFFASLLPHANSDRESGSLQVIGPRDVSYPQSLKLGWNHLPELGHVQGDLSP